MKHVYKNVCWTWIGFIYVVCLSTGFGTSALVLSAWSYYTWWRFLFALFQFVFIASCNIGAFWFIDWLIDWLFIFYWFLQGLCMFHARIWYVQIYATVNLWKLILNQLVWTMTCYSAMFLCFCIHVFAENEGCQVEMLYWHVSCQKGLHESNMAF